MPDTDSDRLAKGSGRTVEDPTQARLLTDLDSAKYFEPFLARERTVSAAAAEVGCNVDTMLYRVRQFLAAGLLEVTHLEKRAGRPIKHYRSVADAYFVPFSATPYANLEELFASQTRPFFERLVRSGAELLRKSGRDGRRLFRKADGDVWNDAASGLDNPFSLDEKGVPAAFDFSIELELSAAEAKELQMALHGLFKRFADGQRKGGKTYLWQTVLLPAAE